MYVYTIKAEDIGNRLIGIPHRCNCAYCQLDEDEFHINADTLKGFGSEIKLCDVGKQIHRKDGLYYVKMDDEE